MRLITEKLRNLVKFTRKMCLFSALETNTLTGETAGQSRVQRGHLEESQSLVHLFLSSDRLQLHLSQRLRNAHHGLQLPAGRQMINHFIIT